MFVAKMGCLSVYGPFSSHTPFLTVPSYQQSLVDSLAICYWCLRHLIIWASVPLVAQTSTWTWTEKGEAEKEEKLYKLSLNLEVNFSIIPHIFIYNLIMKIKGRKDIRRTTIGCKILS